ncbi:MAG: phosphoadenylyl-sulfate reductase [Rhodopila sp.]
MTGPNPSAVDIEFRLLDPVERLLLLRRLVSGPFVFTTSLGLEDQVLLNLIVESGIAVDVVTLDTGRLFPETYELWARTETHYGLRIRAFYPDANALEALVRERGINGFYASKSARIACCGVRKSEPLGRALTGAVVWITGLRADQSVARSAMPFVAYDPAHDLLKANPLLDWTREQTATFARDRDVPVNPLHNRGFVSIGCAPCTRSIAPGEAERAGRWWWEEDETRECGLHLKDGRLVPHVKDGRPGRAGA